MKKDLLEEVEDTEQYMEKIERQISGCSPEEKINVLSDKLRYWYESALDWRNMCEWEKKG